MILFRAQMTQTGSMETSQTEFKNKPKNSLFYANGYTLVMLAGVFVTFFGSLAFITSI